MEALASVDGTHGRGGGVTERPSWQGTLRTRGDTRRFGRALAAALGPGDLVILEGALGAGKTFLARAIARALGVGPEIPVTSPTFELVHEFEGRLPVVHVDLYRLEVGAAIREMDFTERIARDAVVLVEWGERFLRELGGEPVLVRLAVVSAGQRAVTVAGEGPRAARLIAAAHAWSVRNGRACVG